VVRGRWAAPERDRRIEQIAMADGPAVRVGTESVAGYKDTHARIAEVLMGKRVVEKVTPPGDLLIRVAPLEPIFEAGHVHLLRGDWNQIFLSEGTEYPRGAHDDQVAAMVTGYEMIARGVEWGVL
jgi:predicted phage terminase large subunit-like protein